MLARSFLIESLSKLLVPRTGIKARSSSNLELLALEWRKVHTIEVEYLTRSQLANLDQILCVASLWWGKDCIRFLGTLDQNSGVHGNRKPPLTYNGENNVSRLSIFGWFALIAEKTTFDLGTLDSGERSLPFGLLVLKVDAKFRVAFLFVFIILSLHY